MAKVATAYVEVKPDLGKFREELVTKLKAMNATAKVKIDAEGVDVVSTAVAKVAKNNKKAAAESEEAWKASFAGLDDATGKLGRDQITILDRNIKAQKSYQKQLLDTQRAGGKAQLDELERSIKAQVSLEKQKQAAFAEMHAEALRDDVDRERVKQGILNDLHVRALAVNRDIDERSARDREVRVRHQIEDEVAVIRRVFKDNPFVPESVWRQMELDFDRRFGRAGSTAVRSLQKEISKHKIKVEAEVDHNALLRSLSRVNRSLAAAFPRGGFTSVIRTTFELVAGLIDLIDTGLAKAFKVFGGAAEVAGETAMDAFKGVSGVLGGGDGGGGGMLAGIGLATAGMRTMGTSATGMGSAFASAGGPIAAVVAGIVALVAAMAQAILIIALVQAVLGGLLSIIIPLVAGIMSLVAELGALGAAVGASFGLLPGVLGVALAAFGPLLLVMDKFSTLMEDTATHTGELFVTVERLRNAIFAVISSGFVDAIKGFATSVLPSLLGGIEAVAKAWNGFFLGLIKLASAKGTVLAFNAQLRTGAVLVDAMAAGVQILGPALLAMATAALPAIGRIVTLVLDLVGYFALWVAQIQASGQLASFMGRLADMFDRVFAVVKALLPFFGALFDVLLTPATRFLAVLSEIIGQWTAWMTSAAGQDQITTFMSAMLGIFRDVSDLALRLVQAVLAIGPAFADMMSAAGPALGSLVGIFVLLVETLAPYVTQFLEDFNRILSDPKMLASVAALGDALGKLMLAIISNQSAIRLVIDALTALVIALTPTIYLINAAAGQFTRLYDAARLAYNPLAAVALAAQIAAGGMGSAGSAAAIMGAQMSAGAQAAAGLSATLKGLVGGAVNAAVVGATIGAIRQEFENIIGSIGGIIGGLGNTFANAFGGPVATKFKDSAGSAGKGAGKNTAAGFLTSLTPALSKLDWKTLIKGGKAYDTGREIAQYLAKGITSGSKNIEKVTNLLLKRMGGKKGPLQAILNQLAAYRKALIAGGHDEAYWTKQLAAIKDFKARVVETLTAGRNLVGTFGFIPTPAEVANQLQAVYDQLLNFTTTLTELQKRGLSKSLAAEWLQAGPEQAGNLVAGLENATPEQLAAINTLYAKIGTTANTQAEQAAKNFYGVGQATVEGYIKAIRDGTSRIAKAIQAMLEAGVKAGLNYLGIKSPSTVFADMGVNTMLGYIIGINDKADAVAASITDVYGRMTAVPGPQLSTPTLTQQRFLPYAGIPTQAQPTATMVKVYLGDKEITDILRVQVDNYDTTRARALLAGRRGG